MPPGAGCDENQPVGALVDGLARKADAVDVGEHGSAIVMHGVDDAARSAQSRDNDIGPVARDEFKLGIKAAIGGVGDHVGSKGGGCTVGAGRSQPFVQNLDRAGVGEGEGCHQPRRPCRRDQPGAGDQEHGCHHGGKPHAGLEITDDIRRNHTALQFRLS